MPAESPFRQPDPGFSLIETLRWEPDLGFVRLDRHLARLAESARELGFRYDRATIERALSDGVRGDTTLRVRLLLPGNGKATVATQHVTPLPDGAFWTIRPARTRLSSTDPLLRHKTTRRTVYDAARAEYSPFDADEVILSNERGEVCEGSMTSLFVDFGDGGPLVTPPLASGLLAGVLRQELIDDGMAVESLLEFDDLARCRSICCGNSLRGLIPSRLAAD